MKDMSMGGALPQKVRATISIDVERYIQEFLERLPMRLRPIIEQTVRESLERDPVVTYDKDKGLKVSEVAKVLKMSEGTTRRYIKKGKLRGYRVGSDFRVQMSEVLLYIKNNSAKTGGSQPPLRRAA